MHPSDNHTIFSGGSVLHLRGLQDAPFFDSGVNDMVGEVCLVFSIPRLCWPQAVVEIVVELQYILVSASASHLPNLGVLSAEVGHREK